MVSLTDFFPGRVHRIIEQEDEESLETPTSQTQQDAEYGPSIPPRKRTISGSVVASKSKISRLRELAVGHIVASNLPLSTFDGPFIRELLQQFNPQLARDLHLGRTAMTSEVHRLFSLKKQSVKEEIANALTSIHFSFDLWTSPNQRAFIDVFAHFLDQAGKYKSRLMAFRHQTGAHSGENIASTLETVVRDWGFAHKVGVAVCDNASNNDTCLDAFFHRINPTMTDTDILSRRIRCFGHVLNLVAKAFLFGNDGAFEMEIDNLEQAREYDLARARWRQKGPIGKLHNIVKFIRASPQRIEAFNAFAKELESETFRISEATTAELQLCQDNATRWNSTYLMVARAWKKRGEIEAFISKLDVTAHRDQRLPAEDHLSSDDWLLLGEIQNILEPLYALTMETQGWPRHGQLHLVMTGIEYILTHFEAWKEIYSDPTMEDIDVTASLEPQTPQTQRSTRRQRQRDSRTRRIFREGALPAHTRAQYTSMQQSTSAREMAPDEWSQMRASINSAWSKLQQYYSRLADSPLFAAALILHPKYNITYLRAIWRDEEQLAWVKEAEDDLAAFFAKWYLPEPSEGPPRVLDPAQAQSQRQRERSPSRFQAFMDAPLPRGVDEDEDELERYYRMGSQKIEDPVQWWLGNRDIFPRLSRLALDIFAIPAMASDCERAFSNAKLTMTSQRIRMSDLTLEVLQLLKNWLCHGAIILGGLKADLGNV